MRYTKPKLIQLIHVAKHQLQIGEESYRAMLEAVTGKDSTVKMTIEELSKVFNALESKGFKVRSRRGFSPKTRSAVSKSAISGKIRAVWIAMYKAGVIRDGSEFALNKWVRSVVNPLLEKQGKPILLNVQSLDNRQASLVLERLKKWQARTC